MKKIPESVFLQTMNKCNSLCVLCPYKDTYIHSPTEYMPIELFIKILGDLTPEYSGHIGLFLHYEPLLDSRLPELITLAKEMCPMSCVAISTNAALLNDENIDRICSSPLDSITFNVNGGTKETYEKMMPPLKWETTIGNIKKFLKKYKNRKDINFTKTNENFNESELLKEIFPDVKIEDQYWAVNRGGSVKINKPPDVKNRFKYSIKKCKQLSSNLSITCDGSILLCSNCWKREVVLGNAHSLSIIDVWNNNPLKHYNHTVCKNCD
jgi:MoaA/NifB/PqqE/SkfB family radical SAM enzyme